MKLKYHIKNKLLTILFFLSAFLAVGQDLNENWYFATFNGLNFSNPNPQSIPGSYISSAGVGRESVGTVTNSQGIILQCDGEKVWQTNNPNPLNQVNLTSHYSSAQGVLFVPLVDSPDDFYIITNPQVLNNPVNDLTYSLLEFDASSNTYSISQINTFISTFQSEKMTTTLHADGDKYWLVYASGINNPSNNVYTQEYFSFLIDVNGINTTPVVSTVNYPATPSGNLSEKQGNIKISRDGTKIVNSSRFGYRSVLYDFDNTTGQVSNPRLLQDSAGYGCEFSPNGNFIYLTNDGTFKRYPVNINTSVIAPDYETSNYGGKSIQIALNNRIYFTNGDLYEIENPNVSNTNQLIINDVSNRIRNQASWALPQWVHQARLETDCTCDDAKDMFNSISLEEGDECGQYFINFGVMNECFQGPDGIKIVWDENGSQQFIEPNPQNSNEFNFTSNTNSTVSVQLRLDGVDCEYIQFPIRVDCFDDKPCDCREAGVLGFEIMNNLNFSQDECNIMVANIPPFSECFIGNIEINWGDGSSPTTVTNNFGTSIPHTYVANTSYPITVTITDGERVCFEDTIEVNVVCDDDEPCDCGEGEEIGNHILNSLQASPTLCNIRSVNLPEFDECFIGNISINWGDGTIDTVTDNTGSFLVHAYNNNINSSYDITVTVEDGHNEICFEVSISTFIDCVDDEPCDCDNTTIVFDIIESSNCNYTFQGIVTADDCIEILDYYWSVNNDIKQSGPNPIFVYTFPNNLPQNVELAIVVLGPDGCENYVTYSEIINPECDNDNPCEIECDENYAYDVATQIASTYSVSGCFAELETLQLEQCYEATISWGDGSNEIIPQSGVLTHTYPTTNTVNIYTPFITISLVNGVDCTSYILESIEVFCDGRSAQEVASIDTSASVKLTPNPTEGRFSINSTEDAKISKVDLFSTNGILIKTFNGNQREYDASEISNGLIFVQITFKDGTIISKKILIKK